MFGRPKSRVNINLFPCPEGDPRPLYICGSPTEFNIPSQSTCATRSRFRKCFRFLSPLIGINVKNFHGSLTTVVRAHFALVKEALSEIGCVVTSLVVGWLVGRWLVVTRVHCGQTVHPRPIVTMEH